MSVIKPQTEEEISAIVRDSSQVRVRGAGTKASLVRFPSDAQVLDVRSLSGIVDYEPTEFTITARAGTSLRELTATLAEYQQFLPFDPPLVDQGATIGGTIAAGLSGPGQLRFGSVRDFVLH